MCDALLKDGFALVRAVFSASEVSACLTATTRALSCSRETAGVRSSRGRVYAARNLGKLWPGLRDVEDRLRARVDLDGIVGTSARLVRAIYFDKPPGRSWTLPWHRDTMLAVKTTSPAVPSGIVVRAGVPHIRGRPEVLAGMLTARLHLDDTSETNGALVVAPGSHRGTDLATTPATAPDVQVTIDATAGDVLLMRPLLLHRSNDAIHETHRRVVHLEFAGATSPERDLCWAEPYDEL